MPYVSQIQRTYVDYQIDDLLKTLNNEISTPKIEGILNYVITRILLGTHTVAEGLCYAELNTKIGVLECVKLELYRRIGDYYEDEAERKNGDVQEYKDAQTYIEEKFK